MSGIRVVLTSFLLGVIALVGVGCKRENLAPDRQTTTGLQARARPMSVSGCLRKGVADNTFVLVSSQTTGATTAATYQLSARDTLIDGGESASAALQKYVGQSVEVTGTLRAEEKIASKGTTVPEEPAKGTSGTPTVGTKTDLDVRMLTVDSVKPLGRGCEQ